MKQRAPERGTRFSHSNQRTVDQEFLQELLPGEVLTSERYTPFLQRGDALLILPWDPLTHKRDSTLTTYGFIDASARLYGLDWENLQKGVGKEDSAESLHALHLTLQGVCYDLFATFRTETDPFDRIRDRLLSNYVHLHKAFELKASRNLPRRVTQQLTLRALNLLDLQRPDWYLAKGGEQGLPPFDIEVFEAFVGNDPFKLYVYPPEAFESLSHRIRREDLLRRPTIQVQQENMRSVSHGAEQSILQTAASAPAPEGLESIKRERPSLYALLSHIHSIRVAQRKKGSLYSHFDFSSIFRDHDLCLDVMRRAVENGQDPTTAWYRVTEALFGEDCREAEITTRKIKPPIRAGAVYGVSARVPENPKRPGGTQDYAVKQISGRGNLLQTLRQFAYASYVAGGNIGLQAEEHKILEIAPGEYLFCMPFGGPKTGSERIHELFSAFGGKHPTQVECQKRGLSAAVLLAARSPRNLQVLNATTYTRKDNEDYAMRMTRILQEVLGPIEHSDQFRDAIAQAFQANLELPKYPDWDAGTRNQFGLHTEDLNLREKPFAWMAADSAGLLYLPSTLEGVAEWVESAAEEANKEAHYWRGTRKSSDAFRACFQAWVKKLPKGVQGWEKHDIGRIRSAVEKPIGVPVSVEVKPETITSLLLSCYIMHQAEPFALFSGTSHNLEQLALALHWGCSYLQSWRNAKRSPIANDLYDGLSRFAERLPNPMSFPDASLHGLR